MNIASKAMLFFFVFLLSMTVYGQNVATKKYEKAVHTADSLFNYGYFELADAAFGKMDAPFSKGEASTELLYIKNKLAECHLRLGNPDQAVKELNGILDHLQSNKIHQNEHAYALNTIGLCLLTKGEPEDALDYFQQAISLLNKQKSPDKAILANVYSSIGLAHWYNGNYELAEEHHQKALQIRSKLFGEKSLAAASSLNDLGLDYVNNDVEKAIGFYIQAQGVYQKFYPENHPKIAYAYNNLAIAYLKKKEYAKSMEYLRKMESIQAAIYPENHPDRAFLALNIAQVYKEEGAEKIALTFYDKAIDSYKALYGPNHPEIANIYNELGGLNLEKRKFKLALGNFQLALGANTPGFVSKNEYSNPDISQCYNPSTLLATLIQKANALEIRYSAQSVNLKDLKTALKCLEASDSLINQLRQFKTNKNDKLSLGTLAVEVYQMGVRIALLMSENTLASNYYKEKAFYFSEKSKSAVLAEAIAETKAKHFANIPDSLLEKEKKLKEDIAFYEQKMAEPSANQLDKLREQLFSASRAYEQFVKSLEANFPAYYSLKYDVKLPTVRELQDKLPANTALVSYQIADSTHRVYTFVITKKQIKVYDEALMPDFDKWLKGYRNSILFRSESDFVTSATKLHKQMFPFQLPKAIENIIVVQDSKTGGIPFESMLSRKPAANKPGYSKMDFVLNRYSVSYAFSAHLWYDGTKKKETNLNPSIILFAPIRFAKMANLPGTEAEVKGIGGLFEAKQFKNTAYTLKDASEHTIKMPTLRDYKFLHLATHGLVNIRKPELSAVFLCPDSSKKEKNDGMLYSGEIYNLDIRADLVTLSACETGLGKVSRGEGIIGLTRALLYAGANNMVVSLWTVSDRSTSDLMQTFYGYMLDHPKLSYSSSLSYAKKQLVRSAEFSAPYYWAAFVLIGK